MAWLQSILDTENSTGLELVLVTLSLAIVLILVFWIVRKIMGNPARRAARNRVPRLSVTDAAVVDDKRRLVLVRRDDVEHLVMIGGPTDVVIESNVKRMQPAAMPPVTETQAPAPGTNTGKHPSGTDNEPMQPKVEDRKSVSESATAVAAAGTAAIASQTKPAREAKPQEPAADKVAVEFKKEVPEQEVKADAEPATPKPVEPALDELENTISAGLDDALADIAQPDPAQNQNEQAAPPLDDAGPENAENMDDEMQRLLDELAEETKETA